MKALFFDNELQLVDDYPNPQPSRGEALVRVLVAGICNTDLEIIKGYMGFKGVPGHEFVGVVEGSPKPEQVGKRVVGEINAPCGECEYCRQGLERHCPNRSVLGIQKRDGAFAEYLTLPAHCLRTVPDSIPNERAVFTEPVAAAVEITEQVEFEEGAKVLVLGDGKLGLLIAQVLSAIGLQVSLVAHHPDRAKRVLPEEVEIIEGSPPEGRKYPYVVEATGNPQGLRFALAATRPRGKLILKSTTAENPDISFAQIVIDEIEIVGSRCGPFEPALRLLAGGKIQPESMVDARYPLDQASEAFEHAAKPGVCKVLLEIGS